MGIKILFNVLATNLFITGNHVDITSLLDESKLKNIWSFKYLP